VNANKNEFESFDKVEEDLSLKLNYLNHFGDEIIRTCGETEEDLGLKLNPLIL